MGGYRTELVVQLTENGKAQVLSPHMSEPRTLKPGEQLRFGLVLELPDPEERPAADWSPPRAGA